MAKRVTVRFGRVSAVNVLLYEDSEDGRADALHRALKKGYGKNAVWFPDSGLKGFGQVAHWEPKANAYSTDTPSIRRWIED